MSIWREAVTVMERSLPRKRSTERWGESPIRLSCLPFVKGQVFFCYETRTSALALLLSLATEI